MLRDARNFSYRYEYLHYSRLSQTATDTTKLKHIYWRNALFAARIFSLGHYPVLLCTHLEAADLLRSMVELLALLWGIADEAAAAAAAAVAGVDVADECTKRRASPS